MSGPCRMLILVVPFFVTNFRIGGVSGTGLSLTGCDDVCGVAKEPKFGGNSRDLQSNPL